ncbi:hypothetical protein AWN76_005515 [Rhodothermaceae bacterium RA]|nr:hypothetical protein AWN76_005515 [Rhodothermaceae bacterium RA]
MALTRADLDKLVQDLKQRRDELRVKMSLARAEARDEWEKLEQKWEELEAKLEAKADKLEDVAEETTENLEAALELAAEELKKGYARIRAML